MAKVLDCKYIILDHISIIVSDQRHGDERRALDEISTKLKCLTVDLDICLIMVSHLRRSSGTPHEEGGRTSLADLRGTAGIGQLSNMVIGLERNGQSDDPLERRKTTLRVLKNRFCGYVGPACQLLFDEETHRLTEMVMPDELDAVDLDEFTVIEEESNDE
jgi:twinkle protein